MKSLVHRLFTVLHLEEFQKRRERHLMAKIDHLKEQLQPLEQVCGCVCVCKPCLLLASAGSQSQGHLGGLCGLTFSLILENGL